MLKLFLKWIFPLSWLRRVKSAVASIDWKVAKLLAKSSLGAQLYYLIFNRSFVREQQATLQGRVYYHHNSGVNNTRYIRLRRNIHRLEKGLIMQPRRTVFGLDYIDETVQDFQSYCSDLTKENTSDEQCWFQDVLSEYFDVIDRSHPKIRLAAVCFEQTSVTVNVVREHAFSVSESVFKPYEKSRLVDASISSEQLQALVKQRRSVRWFEPTKVSESKLLHAVDIARYAPSACNRQPFEFLIANDGEKASALLQLAMGTVGFEQQVPCAIAVVGDLSSYEAERDRHLIYIDGALAAMQLMLAFETLGLSSCPINWPDIESREKQMTEFLSLSLTQRPIMLIAVGYGSKDGKIPYSQKCSAEQLTTFI